jgi:hypothetical protein
MVDLDFLSLAIGRSFTKKPSIAGDIMQCLSVDSDLVFVPAAQLVRK